MEQSQSSESLDTNPTINPIYQESQAGNKKKIYFIVIIILLVIGFLSGIVLVTNWIVSNMVSSTSSSSVSSSITNTSSQSSSSQTSQQVIEVKYTAQDARLLDSSQRTGIEEAIRTQYTETTTQVVSIIGFNLQQNWIILTATPVDNTKQMPLGTFSIVEVRMGGNWQAAVQGNGNVQYLLDLIPDSELSQQSKQALFYPNN